MCIVLVQVYSGANYQTEKEQSIFGAIDTFYTFPMSTRKFMNYSYNTRQCKY